MTDNTSISLFPVSRKDRYIKNQVNYCLDHFAAMGANRKQVLAERFKLFTRTEYRNDWYEYLKACELSDLNHISIPKLEVNT